MKPLESKGHITVHALLPLQGAARRRGVCDVSEKELATYLLCPGANAQPLQV